MTKLGQSVKAWRSLRGLTQEQVADRAGVSRPTIVKIEAGTGNVKLESVVSVMRAIGVMDRFIDSVDPLNSDVGRLRASETVPERVHSPRTPKRPTND